MDSVCRAWCAISALKKPQNRDMAGMMHLAASEARRCDRMARSSSSVVAQGTQMVVNRLLSAGDSSFFPKSPPAPRKRRFIAQVDRRGSGARRAGVSVPARAASPMGNL